MDVGPCAAWPIECACCDTGTASPAVTGAAAMAATEVLWALSGRRFDECPVTLYPECGTVCDVPGVVEWLGSYLPFGRFWYEWVPSSSPYELVLPGPVARVTRITIDGTVVPTGSYMLFDASQVVRTDGAAWPTDCTDPTGWAVEVTYGHAVPQLGLLAAAELMCELVKACTPGEVCRLPVNVTAQTRQGISQQFIDTRQLVEQGFTGLYLSDLFIQTFNPSHLRGRPRVYNPDVPGPRWSG